MRARYIPLAAMLAVAACGGGNTAGPAAHAARLECSRLAAARRAITADTRGARLVLQGMHAQEVNGTRWRSLLRDAATVPAGVPAGPSQARKISVAAAEALVDLDVAAQADDSGQASTWHQQWAKFMTALRAATEDCSGT